MCVRVRVRVCVCVCVCYKQFHDNKIIETLYGLETTISYSLTLNTVT